MLEEKGTIFKVKNGQAIIIAPIDIYKYVKQKMKNCLVRYDDGRHINAEQRKKAYAILRDISDYTGDMPEYTKEMLKYEYIERYGEKYFSLSNCTMSTARDFISFLIDFCFEHNIGTRDTMLNRTDDISRYLYSCIANRKCVICNNKAEIHHCEGSRVGMGFNRKEIHNVGRKAIALCRAHHNRAHMYENKFFDEYHIYGIELDSYLCKKTGLKE